MQERHASSAEISVNDDMDARRQGQSQPDDVLLQDEAHEQSSRTSTADDAVASILKQPYQSLQRLSVAS